jgi:hypothetical protein
MAHQGFTSPSDLNPIASSAGWISGFAMKSFQITPLR